MDCDPESKTGEIQLHSLVGRGRFDLILNFYVIQRSSHPTVHGPPSGAREDHK